ncbi:S1-like domain-containing RNA-binding protein [Cytophagaceae bacterium DM2B3-1]|uniref:S1-like domain-containing RNA-binding protein n=1 Tax=Xanthocytophaga flava TaxID=3048013 RepID=A0ABT7CKV7_9BACT|nr:S1-like domain-containing RNA-binding protein [Xanthocytophaga flavus]MDJ1469824.1 S1-like domain-containing RNA-binding protein [Xanthocytophaga flavus]MDJ1494337.1 S1-like domain-containing RNA-binding protein [Xanthocytophaga flavus]
MAKIGRYNLLKVVKVLDFGIYLDGGKDGEILMPKRYVPEDCKTGDRIDAFIYLDSEDRIIATTETPLAQVGDFAYLKAVSINATGAFLDWGLLKDLLVPFREQKMSMQEGKFYIVYVYLDEGTRRIVASAKIEQFLDKSEPELEAGQLVDLLIYQKTELGFKAIINNQYSGMLYDNEIFQPLTTGDRIIGYVKQVREDFKIDLILHKPGFDKVEDIAESIFIRLQEEGGFMAVTDKSPAETIYELFGISKKTYKKAVGDLYKRRLIVIEETGIRLT